MKQHPIRESIGDDGTHLTKIFRRRESAQGTATPLHFGRLENVPMRAQSDEPTGSQIASEVIDRRARAPTYRFLNR